MRYYNNRTKFYYESPQALVVGQINEAIRIITEYGFFAAMIHVDDGGPIPSNRQFIVADTVPDGWTGETITADRFVETMNARIVNPGKLPSLIRQATTFAGAMIDFAKDGFRTVDDAERDRRLAICQPCERFVGGRCSTCGCYTDFKSWIRIADCPLGKWKHH